MSAIRPRSYLVVDNVSPSGLAAAARLSADQAVVDLDSLPADRKHDFTRLEVARSFIGDRWLPASLAVQVNRRSTIWADEDLIQLVLALGSDLDCVVLPDGDEAGVVAAASTLLDEMEREFPVRRAIGLEACVNPATAVAGLTEAARSSPRLRAFVINPAEGDQDSSRAIAVANRHMLGAIDGSPLPRDSRDSCLAAARQSFRVGFCGRVAMDAEEIEICATAFAGR